MKMLIGLTALFVLVACGGSPPAQPSPSLPPSPSPTATPQDFLTALIAELNAVGAPTRQAGEFSSEPLGGRGVTLCVAGEPVNTYVFDTPEEAAARASTIDQRDPSHIGNAIVEWMGTPNFWLYGSVLVLYAGSDQPLKNALASVLGNPFASGQPGRPALQGPGC